MTRELIMSNDEHHRRISWPATHLDSRPIEPFNFRYEIYCIWAEVIRLDNGAKVVEMSRFGLWKADTEYYDLLQVLLAAQDE